MVFGILSGVLQVAGYLYYANKARKRELEPNSTSWIMWGYGTSLLLVIELDSGATAAMLILPTACALSSIAVGFICWQHNTLRWPKETWERTSLYTDLMLTAMYAGTWVLLGTSLLSDTQKEAADIAILVLVNLSTFVTFIPMLINTWREPRNENPWPWTVWTAAYLALGLTTVSSPEWKWYLLMYPVECMLLHAAVAWISRRHVLADAQRIEVQQPMKRVIAGPSRINGRGVFAGEDINAGERIRHVEGTIISHINTSKEESLSNPDWIGIGHNRWIDPAGTFKFLNHSCGPNVGAVTIAADTMVIIAMKDIEKGDELTLDYSTTECDPHWEMACTCGSVRCRKIVRSIFTLPIEQYEGYLPYVPKYFQAVYERENANKRIDGSVTPPLCEERKAGASTPRSSG
ncbi:SET domain-containing protein [Allomesorhizobium alhagi]|uniref:SET domain-containing protein n=1 Tax=Allomesorhizobium alhagi TaxID=475067 RepID=UPI001300C088|nr:SET domain-containing protein-lysine N-methyltransferase [Mesorhizobium alhagi]